MCLQGTGILEWSRQMQKLPAIYAISRDVRGSG